MPQPILARATESARSERVTVAGGRAAGVRLLARRRGESGVTQRVGPPAFFLLICQGHERHDHRRARAPAPRARGVARPNPQRVARAPACAAHRPGARALRARHHPPRPPGRHRPPLRPSPPPLPPPPPPPPSPPPPP